MSEGWKVIIGEPSDHIVDWVIAAAGGDMREAIRALVPGQDAIRSQVLRHVSPDHPHGRLQ